MMATSTSMVRMATVLPARAQRRAHPSVDPDQWAGLAAAAAAPQVMHAALGAANGAGRDTWA
jgi:hypothetical protein